MTEMSMTKQGVRDLSFMGSIRPKKNARIILSCKHEQSIFGGLGTTPDGREGNVFLCANPSCSYRYVQTRG